MRQYKQTIRSPLHIILKKYLLFYALPLLVLLPIATKAVISTIPHVPEYSGSLLSLYIHCYTGKFLFFAIPTLIFLAMVAYSNNSHPIEIRNNILILPIQTGSCIGKNAATLVPLQDIISIETKSLHEPLPEKSHLNQEEEEVKEYLISCPGYLGDWMVVEFNRPKKGFFRLWMLIDGEKATTHTYERIRIEFPSATGEEIIRVINQYNA